MSDAQDEILERNREAWNAGRYDAWVAALGPPEAEARVLAADPAFKVRRLLPHMGDVTGKRVCNVQGSHARVAVALALLGAAATVIDFAEENRRYGLELAAAAGVSIDYRLSDAMKAGALGLAPFDFVVMELGILHYHRDVTAFFRVIAGLLAPGGRMILNEFHPANMKLRRQAAADYFNAELLVGDVPNPTGGPERLGQCTLRLWTLGEVVTAAIDAGLVIEKLIELPRLGRSQVPRHVHARRRQARLKTAGQAPALDGGPGASAISASNQANTSCMARSRAERRLPGPTSRAPSSVRGSMAARLATRRRNIASQAASSIR
ncbi:MAG TPA: methyltransferase domain-containing protein [Caulobacteraceae bacterium]|nr:methyltransferase domain-containing protein [Caulobacteraceae bacterium]